MRRPPTCRSCCRRCASTTASWRVTSNGRGRAVAPVCLSGPVELLRRAASARVDCDRARPRLGRAARCGGVHADQSPRPQPVAARFRRRSRSTRCSATRPASAACWRARRRWRSCGGRGLPAARSPSRRCRATGTISPRARRRSKTARRTIWRCRRSRSGWSTSTPIGIDTIHERVPCLTGWLLDRLMPLRHTNGAAAGAHLRPALDRPPRRHRDVQLLRRRRPRHRSPRGRSSARTPPASRCAPDASAIPAAARSRSASPAPSCRRASVSRSTRPT